MKLAEICIRRPILIIVLNLVLVLIGILSWQQLSLRFNPKVFRPRISINYSMQGVNPEYVERNITTPVETALRNVTGVSYMQSWSDSYGSSITLHFNGLTQNDFITAEADVNKVLGQVRLPAAIPKADVNTGGRDQQEIMLLAVHSSTYSQQQLSNYINNNLVQKFEHVPGVGSVAALVPQNALRINLNPEKMAVLHVSVDAVKQALDNTSQGLLGSVLLPGKKQTILLNVSQVHPSIRWFNNIVVRSQNRHAIKLQDVAKISIGYKSFEPLSTLVNGEVGGGLRVMLADGANPIKTSAQIRQQLSLLKQTLPVGMHLVTVFDTGKIFQHSMHEFYLTILQAILMVVMVTFLFLGSFSFTRIPAVTIPVCMVSGFSIMLLLGFSINLMTLLALILAVGLVVDDAIVVFENSYRHVELGNPPDVAAKRSMREVLFPVIGMTLSIAAVYMPTIFMHGRTAVYFQQFAFTLSGMVLISGFVALTLTPMMCSRIKAEQKCSRYKLWLDAAFMRVRLLYQRFLSIVLQYRIYTIIIFLGLIIAGGYVFSKIKSTLEPAEYAGLLWVRVKAPDTASNAYVKKLSMPIIRKIMTQPEVQTVMSIVMGDSGSSNFVALKPGYTSSKQTQLFADKLQRLFKKTVNVSVYASPYNINMHSRQNNPAAYSVYLQGFADDITFKHAAANFVTALKKTGLFLQVDNTLQASQQELGLSFNEDKERLFGVTPAQVNTAFNVDIAGYKQANGFYYAHSYYPIIMQIPLDKMQNMNVLRDIYIENNQQKFIALNRIATLHQLLGVSERVHQNGVPAVEVDLTAKTKVSEGDVLKVLQTTARNVLPNNIQLSYSQHFLDMLHGNHTMISIFALGILFIYLILAALFESFRDPLIILLTVPLCIVGALFALYMLGGSINLFTSIGLVTLIGLVSKHGVLITHFANRCRVDGMNRVEAVIEAAGIRLRPILMTTATMIIGALPLVLSVGFGSVSRMQIGVVIIAGLFVGTLFSLFVVPVAYSFIAKK